MQAKPEARTWVLEIHLEGDSRSEGAGRVGQGREKNKRRV